MTYFNEHNTYAIRSFLRPLAFSEGRAVYASNQAYTLAGIDKDIAKILDFQNNLNWLLNGRLDIGVNYENWSLNL